MSLERSKYFLRVDSKTYNRERLLKTIEKYNIKSKEENSNYR